MAVDQDYAWSVVQRLYADVGHTAGSDELNDLQNRIRNGQSIDAIIANTYDDAQRRFKTVDTPASRAADPTAYDAQKNVGRSFDPPAVMLEELAAPAREQATAMAQGAIPPVSRQLINPLASRTNSGPADAYTPSGFLGGMDMTTILLIAGLAIGGIVLFKALGKK